MRFAVEYACPGWEARDQAYPLGFVAQDVSGLHLVASGIDLEPAAEACGLPVSALARWERDARSRAMDPVWGPDGKPLAQTDPQWLTRFASAGAEAKFYWGPVREVPGSGPEALEAISELVRAEAPRRPGAGSGP